MQSPISFLRLFSLGAVLAAASFTLSAQDNSDGDWNHFGLNFRAGFDMEAKFSASSTLAFPPGPGAGNVNRQYEDGFVDVDSSANQGGRTWNFGYQSPSQASGGNLLMHSTDIDGGSQRATDDPNLGLDFNYVRDVGHQSWGQWGIKIAFGYTHVNISDNDPMNVNLATLTDTYPTPGVVLVPSFAPYTGSFSGPGPLINSMPASRAYLITPGILSGNQKVDADLFDLRLGPSFNIPLFKRFSFQGGGGLAIGLVDSDYSFNEHGTTSTGAISASGSSSSTGFLAGAYVEAGFAYRICHSTSLFTGAQFEYLGDFRQSADGDSAQLDFGKTIFYELGLQWNF